MRKEGEFSVKLISEKLHPCEHIWVRRLQLSLRRVGGVVERRDITHLHYTGLFSILFLPFFFSLFPSLFPFFISHPFSPFFRMARLWASLFNRGYSGPCSHYRCSLSKAIEVLFSFFILVSLFFICCLQYCLVILIFYSHFFSSEQ